MITINGEVYVTATGASLYMNVSRVTFYQNLRPLLRIYKLPGLRRPYYRRAELDQLKQVQPMSLAS